MAGSLRHVSMASLWSGLNIRRSFMDIVLLGFLTLDKGGRRHLSPHRSRPSSFKNGAASYVSISSTRLQEIVVTE